VPYPVASSPQAWAAGALPYALWHLLGLHADALNRTLRIVAPILPTSVTRVDLVRLRFGGAGANIRFQLDDEARHASVDAAVTRGTLNVVVETA
jgi:hypothetical protein